MKGKLITVVMLGFSINAHAELAAASNWLTSSVRNSAYSHYYAIKSPASGTARSYAISARNDARKACTEAKASYAFSLTDGAFIAQSEACDASTYLGKEVTYWNSNRITAATYGRKAEISRASAIEWVNFEWGLFGNY